ncbi:MAG: cysteine desulfurase family protein [Akkermansiaceae bacterium]
MIYLDSNATTKIHPEVLEAMMPFLTEHCYNPSSGYSAAKVVRKALDLAREQVAALIHAQPDEIVFTGGGTESNNSALSFLAKKAGKRKKIVTSAIEHSAILRYSEALCEDKGFSLEKVGVGPDGRLLVAEFAATLGRGDAAMASLMWANNETGVIQPIAEACEAARAAGVPFHTDAIQAVGKIPVDVTEAPIDFLSISGHKFHAPKGVGALYIRNGMSFDPLLIGGGQEKGRRSGTENVASIIGLGKAAEIMKQKLDTNAQSEIAALRDHFEKTLLADLDGVRINGSLAHRTANTSHLSFDGCEAAGLLILLDEYGIQCSAGSACMTGKQQPSHVQTAMGIPALQAKSSLRISFSILTTQEETETAIQAVKKAVNKLRSVQGSTGTNVGPVQIFS